MTEAFLHYIWQHQMVARNLSTTEGLPLVVRRAGDLNRDAGPDFFNAHIAIDGVEWVGNIEVHLRSSDWNAHRHTSDPVYNNVILHVVYEHDGDIRLQNGTVPPTLELRRFVHPALVANYDALMQPPADDTVPCAARLPQVPSFVVSSALERLAVERIEEKALLVRRLLDESRGSWEQTCYWLMARYFGGKVNALPFELLAKATDQRLLARWKDNPRRIEALLMGQAGLLEGYFEDDYPRLLQADYEALQAGAGLKPISGDLWRHFRLRPSAFPTIRISQFAHLVASSSNLFSTLLDITDASRLVALFDCQAAPYWDNHYHFDQPSAKAAPKRLGTMQAQLLAINAWVPLLFVYGELRGQQACKEQALALLQQLPPEDNAVLRRFRAAGLRADNAAQSQALLQLYGRYCSGRRCLACRLGHSIIKQIPKETI
ncbi:MAG: DUF2851 family protein [Bacteroidales bacterium]|nr:DUF2851 family protein [Bacteroidales bacterium]